MKKRVLSVQFVIASHQREQDVEYLGRVDGCSLESRGGIRRSDNRLHQLLRHGDAKRLEAMGVEKYAEPTRRSGKRHQPASANMRQKNYPASTGLDPARRIHPLNHAPSTSFAPIRCTPGCASPLRSGRSGRAGRSRPCRCRSTGRSPSRSSFRGCSVRLPQA